jgi:hypothetical protein
VHLKSGLTIEVAFGGSGFIREVAIGGSGIIKRGTIVLFFKLKNQSLLYF